MSSINVTIFGIDLVLKPIAFTIALGSFRWDVYWYGIIIATGFLLALIYGYTNAKRLGVNTDRMLDVVLVAAPIAILSARAYYVIFDDQKLEGIGDFFGFGNSSGFAGLAIYGAVIGAFLSGALMCYIRKVDFFKLADLGVIGFLIGQCVGRWGNFVNQEAYGTFTNSSWWGMQSDRTIIEVGAGLVHPCFLYESIWCLIGFFVLHYFSKKRKFKGQIALMYCVWYGFGRGFIELLRTDSLTVGNIRVSSLLSFVICITAIVMLVVLNKKLSTDNEEYSEQFIEEAKTEEIENGEID